MKQYQETESGCFVTYGMTIPASPKNSHYRLMMAEVEAGEAEILPYVEPEITADQKIAELEASITPRNMRGAALGDEFAIAKIAEVEAAITELRE